MIDFLLGLVAGLPSMWIFARFAPLASLREASLKRRALMRESFMHDGSFRDLLTLQRLSLVLSARHLRMLLLPALIASLPIVIVLVLWPQLGTWWFGGGIALAYVIMKVLRR